MSDNNYPSYPQDPQAPQGGQDLPPQGPEAAQPQPGRTPAQAQPQPAQPYTQPNPSLQQPGQPYTQPNPSLQQPGQPYNPGRPLTPAEKMGFNPEILKSTFNAVSDWAYLLLGLAAVLGLLSIFLPFVVSGSQWAAYYEGLDGKLIGAGFVISAVLGLISLGSRKESNRIAAVSVSAFVAIAGGLYTMNEMRMLSGHTLFKFNFGAGFYMYIVASILLVVSAVGIFVSKR
ncbi:hypothetical protein BSR28_05560 [Boudabousia liubingyangii]|uniref:hypothetical protein n=1 Tax=Boudabousia liubingyangii TaxID=1921764 RepID=UPI00093D492C|nr:hypothetical protein [Boudabousia liubingyangii]OKL46892.1 hypothetical protein BSR28_05560 [Boudabousia liubingyangii]